MSTIVDQGLQSAVLVTQGYVASVPSLAAPLAGYAVYLYAPAPGSSVFVPSAPGALGTSAEVGLAVVGLALLGQSSSSPAPHAGIAVRI